jgi:site-specific recombinase XerD
MRWVHFKLRAQGSRDPRIILHVFNSQFKGRKFSYSTGFSINRKLWDHRNHRAKQNTGTALETVLAEINDKLNALALKCMQFIGEQSKSSLIDSNELRLVLDAVLTGEDGSKPEKIDQDFFDVWKSIIESTKGKNGIKVAKSTVQSKLQTLKLLKSFCEARNKKLTFHEIDLKFYHDFDNYLIQNGYKDNSRGKHFKEIKAVLNEASKRGFEVDRSFVNFKVIRVDTESIYLNEEELKKIFNLDLSNSLAPLRDIFVMACYLGIRNSDWYQINQENLVTLDGTSILKVQQTKTRSIVHIPVNQKVHAILDRYQGNPPRVISNQKFNQALKLIAQKADLGYITVGKETVEKASLVTTHTARRSFATNAYLAGMNVTKIMKLTGHKTEASFFKYLKLNGLDHATLAGKEAFFSANKWD